MTNFTPKNMLVTGGAGFIGANFVRYCLKNNVGEKIINLDKLTYAGSLTNLEELPNPDRHIFVKGDIKDIQLLKKLMREHEIDTIVHFAAESHVDRSIASPIEFVETNVLGTFQLLQASKEYWLEEKGWGESDCRFHHISTDEVYGSLEHDDPAFNETTAYTPRSPYSASKAGSDHLVNAYHHTYGLPVTMSNCSNNYGPYQHSEKFIPTVIRACMNQKVIPVYGNGKNIRDWLYVVDHCNAIVKIITTGQLGENYNVGGDCEMTNIDLALTICAVFDEMNPAAAPYKNLIQYVTDRAGHDFRYAINHRKITSDLGWSPATSFKEGLRKTVAHYLKDVVVNVAEPVV